MTHLSGLAKQGAELKELLTYLLLKSASSSFEGFEMATGIRSMGLPFGRRAMCRGKEALWRILWTTGGQACSRRFCQHRLLGGVTMPDGVCGPSRAVLSSVGVCPRAPRPPTLKGAPLGGHLRTHPAAGPLSVGFAPLHTGAGWFPIPLHALS